MTPSGSLFNSKGIARERRLREDPALNAEE